MRKKIDLTGQRIGRLLVIQEEKERSKHGAKLWRCKCDCGNVHLVETGNLTNHTTRSCGCLKWERIKLSNTKHGYSNKRIHRIYYNMRGRCYNPHIERFKNYGGRGIKICDEWLGENGFKNFVKWAMSNGYDDSLSIDRIDVNGNYEPSNCRWITMEMQYNNKSNSHFITFNGETRTLQEWADITGIDRKTISGRIEKCGWSVEKALTTKPRGTNDNRGNQAERINEGSG